MSGDCLARGVRRHVLAASFVAVAFSLPVGCAGPGPKLFPPAPLRVEPAAAGGKLHWYDTNGDGRADYAENIGPDGRIVGLKYLGNGGEQDIDLKSIPAAEQRDLVLILDSVPYPMVRDAWEHGSLPFFPRPTRTIPPFPVMTDPSLVDFFHMSPGVAIESDYYDGRHETDPYDLYLRATIAIWHPKVDYWLSHMAHGPAYLDRMPWFDHELRRIQDGFEHSTARTYIGYCVGTSALGALQGWDGHAKGLARVERFCHEMVYRTRGRVRITLLSDHGHNQAGNSKRVPLVHKLRSFGYHIGDTLKSPTDLVVPEFAIVSCASIYTRSPAGPARDVLKIEGIEMSAYCDPDGNIIVLGQNDGRARISRSPAGYKYEPLAGDPLALRPILAELQAKGQVNADGFVADDLLLAATRDHLYPDGVDRLWRAFHEQFQYKPDVLLATLDGYHCGSDFQTRAALTLKSVHGNLRPLSSSGFAMTAAGELPPLLRMRDLSTALCTMGVNLLR